MWDKPSSAYGGQIVFLGDLPPRSETMKTYATIGDIGHLRPINSICRLWLKRYASPDLSGTRYSMGRGGGISSADYYLTPANTWTRAQHSEKLRQYSTKSDTFKHSFSPRIIPVWNSLPATVAQAPDLVAFKQGLSTLTFNNMVGGNPQVGSEGFWSCAGWTTIHRGSYCSRIGHITQGIWHWIERYSFGHYIRGRFIAQSTIWPMLRYIVYLIKMLSMIEHNVSQQALKPLCYRSYKMAHFHADVSCCCC